MSEEQNTNAKGLSRRSLMKGGLGVAALALGAGAFGFKNLFVSGTHAAAAAVQPAAAKAVTINVEKMIKIALAEVSTKSKESPIGSNKNPYSRYFGFGAQPWCADFLSWVVDHAGNRNKKVPWGHPSAVAGIISWARSHKKMVTTPRRGDIYAIDNSRSSHTGIVTSVNLKKGTFASVSGNTSRPGGGGDYYVYTNTSKPIHGGGYVFIRISQDV